MSTNIKPIRARVPATGPLSPEEARKIIAGGKRALTRDESNTLMEKLSALSNWMRDHSPGQVAEAVGQMTPEHKALFMAFRQIVVLYLDHAMKSNLDNLPAED